MKSFHEFVSKRNQFFPQLITPMKNGKFILHPQFVSYDKSYDGSKEGSEPREIFFPETTLFVELEIFENSTDFNWTYIDLPINVSNTVDQLWVFQF